MVAGSIFIIVSCLGVLQCVGEIALGSNQKVGALSTKGLSCKRELMMF